MKKIEFLFFEGCPSYKDALKNLKDAIAEENIETEIEMINVDSPEKAEHYGFLGSPSIRVNDKDLENKNEGYSYSCRIYTINGKKTGIPTKEFFLNKFRDKIFRNNNEK